MSQKKIFLSSEGDSWLERNLQNSEQEISNYCLLDPLVNHLLSLPLPDGPNISVLEIGCGQGIRLERLKKERGWSVAGIDPSPKAVKILQDKGISAFVGTADQIDFLDASVDLLVYGFCLYLCDRNDLFKIASEAHRVLKSNSWIAIYDFWSPQECTNDYHHFSGLKSFKDDMPRMFSWHSSYTVTNHNLFQHQNGQYTDNPQEWTSTTILRRFDHQ